MSSTDSDTGTAIQALGDELLDDELEGEGAVCFDLGSRTARNTTSATCLEIDPSAVS